MSTRFDDEVQASWGQFEARVGQALAEIGDDSFSIDLEGETEETGAFPYVQFVGYDDMVRAEVAGNDVLDPAYRMDVDQESALVAIGWQQPSDVESPNWWFDVTRDEVDVLLDHGDRGLPAGLRCRAPGVPRQRARSGRPPTPRRRRRGLRLGADRRTCG